MTSQQRCAICDCDRDGNITPGTADALCADHYWAKVYQREVQRGSISDWEPLQLGKYETVVLHMDMLLTKDVCDMATRPLPWQASVVALCNMLGVWWDDGTGDKRDTDPDRYAAMTGLVVVWLRDELVRIIEARQKGQAA